MEVLPEYKLTVLKYDSLGGYIKLPHEILIELKDCSFPIFFKITSDSGLNIITSVKEFTAPENSILMPRWMILQLGINTFDNIIVELVKYVPKAKLVSLEPLEKELFEIKDYDIFLENQLSNHCILQTGNIIQLKIFDNIFNIKISNIELDWEKINWNLIKQNQTENIGEIVNCDLNVDIINNFLEKKEMMEKEEIIEKLTPDELRKKRLAFFSKK